MKDAWSPAVKVYGIVSLSGGQGKTTTAFFLGLHLAERGYKVLFLDADPQANLTFYSGVHLPEGGGDLEKVFRGEDIQGSIYPLSWENLFIIPAGQNLARINEYLASSGNGGRMLDRRLRQIRDWFDYCIIDAPPARSQIVLSVIGASTQIIIPFEVALKGTNCLIETINLLNDLSDLEIWRGELFGVVPFRDKWFGLNQATDARENMEAVRQFLNNRVTIFPAILESTQYRAAIRQGVTLTAMGHPKLDVPFMEIIKKMGVDDHATH
jgi:chromosome partitioning protein